MLPAVSCKILWPDYIRSAHKLCTIWCMQCNLSLNSESILNSAYHQNCHAWANIAIHWCVCVCDACRPFIRNIRHNGEATIVHLVIPVFSASNFTWCIPCGQFKVPKHSFYSHYSITSALRCANLLAYSPRVYSIYVCGYGLSLCQHILCRMRRMTATTTVWVDFRVKLWTMDICSTVRA